MFSSTVLKEMQVHVTVRSTLLFFLIPKARRIVSETVRTTSFVTSEVTGTQFTAKGWKQSKYSVDEQVIQHML